MLLLLQSTSDKRSQSGWPAAPVSKLVSLQSCDLRNLCWIHCYRFAHSNTRTLKNLATMENPREQPDYEAAIQDFLVWVKKACSFEVIDPEPLCQLPFMTADDMRHYFEDDDQRKLKQIISVLFPDDETIWVNDVVPDNAAVFCTLLSISKGRWMKHFRHYTTLSDSALPFTPESAPPNWPKDPKDPDFLKKFCKEQWKFCVPILRSPLIDKALPKDIVLPITFKQKLKTGSSAALWVIKLNPSYNKLITDATKSKLGKFANTFVLKTYFTSEAERYYKTEVAAFRHLGSNPSIIGFHGSFTRGETYNVLLEYADKGTLEDYFKNEAPPTEGEEIIQFWEALFQIIDALRRIHKVKTDAGDGPQIFQGRHQDVKPENILVVSNGSDQTRDWKFKLADLGISHFKGKRPSRQDSAANNTQGTRTYGAPECYRPDDTTMHDTVRDGQNADIWSLGCVYAEAVRWTSDGYRGIQQYRRERESETALISGFRDGDCFHDGEKILNVVREANKKIIKTLRIEDVITRAVIDRLIGDMLGTAEARSTAFQLWHRSRQIVENARKDLEALNAASSSERLSRGSTHSVPPPPPNPPPGIFPGLHYNQMPSTPDQTPAFIQVMPEATSLPTLPEVNRGGREGGEYEVDNTITNGQPAMGTRSWISQSGGQNSWQVPDEESVSAIRLKEPPKLINPCSPPSSPPTQNSLPESHYRKKPVLVQSTPSSGTTERRLASPTHLSLDDALEWKRERKDTGVKRRIKDWHLQDRLKLRDHVFLIDDSISMKPHWKNVSRVFEALSYIVKEVDPNGIDLHFTSSGQAFKNRKTTKELLSLVKNRRHQGNTDINVKLMSILTEYNEALEKPKTLLSRLFGPVRPLNLYILTDGVWEGECNPERLIKSLVDKLVALGKVKMQVGIQFISFGNDPIGIERLEYLDSGMKLDIDIVDTEPWNGNVWKMLLGAINDTFDRHNDRYINRPSHVSTTSRKSTTSEDKYIYK